MSSNELAERVWELIDEHCMELSKTEYVDFLQSIREDAGIRIEATEYEIADEMNQEDEE